MHARLSVCLLLSKYHMSAVFSCNDGYSGVYCESDISPITSPFENSTTTSPAPPRVVGNVGQNKGSNAVGISVGGAIGGLVVVAIIIILVILLVKNVR